MLHVLNVAVSLPVFTGIFALLFRYLPDLRLAWRDVFIGAAFTAVLFTAGKYGIGMYLGKAGFATTYGAAGSLVVVLVWVYYSAQLFFFGAEVTQVYAHERGSMKMRPERRVESAPARVGRGRRAAIDSAGAEAGGAVLSQAAIRPAQNRRSLPIIIALAAVIGARLVGLLRHSRR